MLQNILRFNCKLLLLLFLVFTANVAFGRGTAFTYQGRLTDGGTPASGVINSSSSFSVRSLKANQRLRRWARADERLHLPGKLVSILTPEINS